MLDEHTDQDTPEAHAAPHDDSPAQPSEPAEAETPEPSGATSRTRGGRGAVAAVPLFQAPPATAAPRPARRRPDVDEDGGTQSAEQSRNQPGGESGEGADRAFDRGDPGADDEDGGDDEAAQRRRRRRGGRRRRRSGDPEDQSGPGSQDDDTDGAEGSGDDDTSGSSGGQGGSSGQNKSGQNKSGQAKAGQSKSGQSKSGQGKAGQGKPGQSKSGQGADTDDDELDDDEQSESSSSRRRRRRRRSGDGGGNGEVDGDDPENTVTRVRKPRSAEDEITSFTGSTRLEAKKQRRREGREAGRRRAPIISEAEFLARREAVERTMVIRQRKDLTQIAVLEDKVLVEHYVARESQTSQIGNVYLGRVQNVLPSMEAAFVDIGKGRNAVLYAGEVNWDALGAKDGSQRKIEQVLKPGQAVLVQVTKDPVGHKGARLTSQISLPGRFLVYVPDGNTSGISRKLPDTERSRLKSLLKEIVPESAGVIVRTAAEGASESELTRDVERLKTLWEEISKKVEKGNAPQLLYAEPDLTLKVVRDLFTEDISKLVVSGKQAWAMVKDYVGSVAPDLVERLEKHDDSEQDAFAEHRIDEQIAKALDRKVWLPSGGSLVIDRTEAMTVIDVNTGKFTGSGGNLEETVTKNNLEAAEEIVRQLRLRDIGGIIVVDFIDMVLESNRDLVLRRLIECLGRDRTRHQVAEVTSLGLVQMTRKRIGTGLLEAFSEPCEHCLGRGLHVHHEPVEVKKTEEEPRRGGRRGRGRGKGESSGGGSQAQDETAESPGKRPTPAEFAAMAAQARAEEDADGGEAEAESAPEEPAADEPAAEEAAAEEPAAEESAPEEPAGGEPVDTAPRLVTSVRRVGARRAAGPPSGADGARPSPEAAEEPEEPEEGAEGEDSEQPEHAAADVHVPVKRRGSRKR